MLSIEIFQETHRGNAKYVDIFRLTYSENFLRKKRVFLIDFCH